MSMRFYVMRRSSVALACSNIECLLQIILKKDGYANQPDAGHAEESEELLAPMDEPLSSNTIPELASMSQVLAPNSIHAEMQSISLHSPRSPAADQDWGVHSAVDENSDPNQAAHHSRLHGSSLEMQPLQKQKKRPIRAPGTEFLLNLGHLELSCEAEHGMVNPWYFLWAKIVTFSCVIH